MTESHMYLLDINSRLSLTATGQNNNRKMSSIPETLNLSTDADSRTNKILKKLHDIFAERLLDFSFKKKLFFEEVG